MRCDTILSIECVELTQQLARLGERRRWREVQPTQGLGSLHAGLSKVERQWREIRF
jgi:hypothetical protein